MNHNHDLESEIIELDAKFARVNKIEQEMIKNLDKVKQELLFKKEMLEKCKFFDKDLSFSIIEYLVNLMEDKEYEICRIPIELYSYLEKSGYFEIVDCMLVCLIDTNNIDNVTEKIRNMFPIRKYFVNNKAWNRNCKDLLIANDDYI